MMAPDRRVRQSLAKRWLFTLNNYSDDEVQSVWSFLRGSCSYAIVGKERGENLTPHLQGYFILRVQRRLSSLKDELSSRAHLEIARGSPESNREYCSKEGSFDEIGVCPKGNGHKSRDELAAEWNEAFSGGRRALEDFGVANPGAYAFSRHTLLRNSLASAVPRERPGIRVEWLYGQPGVGKSRMAHERLPDSFIKDPMTKWWTGYMLETSVIIDDFGKRGIGINHLLRWFDRYKCYVETKGDVVPLFADQFIVTSNFHPRDCFFNDDGSVHDQIDALLRRMHVTHVLAYSAINSGL
uniref:Replication-associated protein n=1 Tax=Cressdnaviricota sp. TaxID=2748378 RepID=A0A6M3YUG9_9VIRU|nr:MAG: replication-associated protein [Cressdnaviricota sp.]